MCIMASFRFDGNGRAAENASHNSYFIHFSRLIIVSFPVRPAIKNEPFQSRRGNGNLKRYASRNRRKVIPLSLLFPRSSQLVYHRFKPRAFAVNCTPHCSVMPDGDIAFSRLATANQCAGNWPSNGHAQCVYLLCSSSFIFLPFSSVSFSLLVKRKVFDRWFTGVRTMSVCTRLSYTNRASKQRKLLGSR